MRNILIRLTLVLLLFFFSTTSFCQVDPGTALAAADTAFSAASFVMSIIQSGKKEEQWDQQTTTQLNTITKNTQDILADLKQLRIDVQKTVHGEFIVYVQTKLQTDLDDFNQHLSAEKKYKKLSLDQKEMIGRILFHLEDHTDDLTDYGVASYQNVFSGILATKAMFDFTKLEDKDDQKRYFEHYDAVFEKWIDTNTAGNPSYICAQEKQNTNSFLAQINGIVGTGTNFVTDNFRGFGVFAAYPYKAPFYISGNPTNGYTVTFPEWLVGQNIFNIPNPGNQFRDQIELHRQKLQLQLDNLCYDYRQSLANVNNLTTIQTQLIKYKEFIDWNLR